MTITDSTVADNTNTDGGDGGGVFFDGAALTISGSAITGNTAGDDGGGLYIFGDLARSPTRPSAATRRSSSIAAAASGWSATSRC